MNEYQKFIKAKKLAFAQNKEGDYYWGNPENQLHEIEERWTEKEIDENIETEKECPKCGYKWS